MTMTNATGEFEIAALAGHSVHQPRSDTSKSRGLRHTLTAEEPLRFELKFYNGDSFAVKMYGCGREPTSFWRVMDAVKRLAELPPSWDSYGAKPLSASSVRRIFGFLPALLVEDIPEPAVVPTNDGGLQFEWHHNGVDLEVKVPPVGPISHLFADTTAGTEQEFEGAFDRQLVESALVRLTVRTH